MSASSQAYRSACFDASLKSTGTRMFLMRVMATPPRISNRNTVPSSEAIELTTIFPCLSDQHDLVADRNRPDSSVGAGIRDTTNETGLSTDRGMLLVIVIHGTSAVADHTHRSCVAPPHSVGSLCWMTSNVPDPPAATKRDRALAHGIPAAGLRDADVLTQRRGRPPHLTRPARGVVVVGNGHRNRSRPGAG